jgi:protein gp37
VGEKTAIGWTQHTFNPWRGCKRVSTGCKNCLAPETLILYHDFTWRPIGDVKIGDTLAAFDEKGARIYRTTYVEAIRRSTEPAIRIKTAHTEIVSSYNHLFLSDTGRYWIQAGRLNLQTSKLKYIRCDGQRRDLTSAYQEGYITGITKHAFFAMVQPVLQRKIDSQFGIILQSSASQIILLEDIGEKELIDIQTSTATHNCYMFRDQHRYGLDPTIVTRTKTWGQPKKWQKEAEANNRKDFVFTCSWSDWFIEAADEWRPEAWKLLKETPNLIYQILTKRPELIRDRLPPDWGTGYPNVWLGVSIENNNYVHRADMLREIPSNIRFISAEPLLGPITDLNLEGFKWLIVGGESGPDFRPMDLDWARSLREQCHREGVAFFYKQASGLLPGKYNLLDGQKWEEYPFIVETGSGNNN